MKTETKKRTKTVRKSPSKRTPLSAKNAGGTDLLKIAARLGMKVAAAELTATWREKALAALSSRDRIEGMIRAAQILRDAGALDIESANFIIAFESEQIAQDRIQSDAELAGISAAIEKKRRDAGIAEDDDWPDEEMPDDVTGLYAAWDRRADGIKAAVLREFGEEEMAAALLADYDAFYEKYWEPGRLAQFGPLPERRGTTGSS